MPQLLPCWNLGEPLHAFDYDVLVARAKGKPVHIITRTAKTWRKAHHPGWR